MKRELVEYHSSTLEGYSSNMFPNFDEKDITNFLMPHTVFENTQNFFESVNLFTKKPESADSSSKNNVSDIFKNKAANE